MYEFEYDVGDKVYFRLPGNKHVGFGYGTGTILKASLVDDDSGEVVDPADEERIASGPMFEHYLVQPYFVGPGISYHAYDDGTFGIRGTEVITVLWDENVSINDGNGYYVCVRQGLALKRIVARLKLPQGMLAAIWLGIAEAQNPSVPFENIAETMDMFTVNGGEREWMVIP